MSNPNSKSAGNDGTRYPTLQELKKKYIEVQIQNTKYERSSKSFKIKKTLPKKAVITEEIKKQLKKNRIILKNKVSFQLLKKINIKSFQNNYKVESVRKV